MQQQQQQQPSSGSADAVPSGRHDNGYGIQEYDHPQNLHELLYNLHITAPVSPETTQMSRCGRCCASAVNVWYLLINPSYSHIVCDHFHHRLSDWIDNWSMSALYDCM